MYVGTFFTLSQNQREKQLVIFGTQVFDQALCWDKHLFISRVQLWVAVLVSGVEAVDDDLAHWERQWGVPALGSADCRCSHALDYTGNLFFIIHRSKFEIGLQVFPKCLKSLMSLIWNRSFELLFYMVSWPGPLKVGGSNTTRAHSVQCHV